MSREPQLRKAVREAIKNLESAFNLYVQSSDAGMRIMERKNRELRGQVAALEKRVRQGRNAEMV